MKIITCFYGAVRRLLVPALFGIPYAGISQFQFSEALDLPFGSGEVLLSEFADVDGDSDIDAMIIGRNSAGLFAKLYINNGTGSFTEQSGTPFKGVVFGAMAFADIDGDHDEDLLISGDSETGRISELYLNDGAANFTLDQQNNFEPVFHSTIAFGDIENDGDVDVYLSGYGTSFVSRLYLNNGNGEFILRNHYLPYQDLGSVIFSDYDKDGDLDWFGAGRTNYAPRNYLYVQREGYVFLSIAQFEPIQYASSAVVDLDGDTYVDYFYSGETRSGKLAKLYFNNLNGRYNEGDISEIIAVDKGDLAFQDFDGDLDFDLILSGNDLHGQPSTVLYANDGLGNFSVVQGMGFEQVQGSTISAADFNGDGWADILLTGKTADGSSVSKLYLNQARHNNPPVISEISVEGLPELGQELSVSYSFFDMEGDPDESTYAWFRSDNPSEAAESIIPGAHGKTYTVTEMDQEKFLRLKITPNDGMNQGVEVESSWVGPVRALSPTIAVQGNFLPIEPTSNTPTLDDHTYFGEVSLDAGMEQRTFTIHNSGNAVLEVSSIYAAGLHGSDFEITATVPQTISPGEAKSFSVAFDPNQLGERIAQVVIESNDVKNSILRFNILGKGINNPPHFLSLEEYSFFENESLFQIDINATNGENGAEDEGIVYSISGGADKEYFSIDRETGLLTFNFIPDFEVPVDSDLNNEYILEITANDGGQESNLTSQVLKIVLENFDENPIASCAPAFEVYLDVNGVVTVLPEAVNEGSSDDSGNFSLFIEPRVFGVDHIGPQEVTLTVTDEKGNISTCSVIVTVRDTISPKVMVRNYTARLNSEGTASISVEDIDNGSNDITGIAERSLDRTSFDCSAIGVNEVVLSVTDNNGNTNQAVALVTVEDNLAPSVVVNDIILYLGSDGKTDIKPQDIDNGSRDNCAIDILELDQYEFDCTDIGEIPVTFRVADISGNISSEVAMVKILDTISPLVKVQNLIVILDKDGKASITAADVDDGSTDGCGDVSLSLDRREFGCADIGDVEVQLTVEDSSGNISSGITTVTIKDSMPPDVKVQDLVVTLDENGYATVRAEDFDSGSSDNCGDISFSLDRTEFDCSSLGENILLLTLTDSNGNFTHSKVNLTIADRIAPDIRLAEKKVRQVNGSKCSYTVNGEEFDIMVQDNCGEVSVTNNFNNNPTLDSSTFPLGITVVTWTVTDRSGNSSTLHSEIEITNDAPQVREIQIPDSPILVETSFILWAEYYDKNVKSAIWSLSAEEERYNLNVPGELSANRVTGSFELEAGVYLAKLVVEDICGERATVTSEYLTVYDPEGGFVTGGGWIPVPNLSQKKSISERANFNINVKYKKGNKSGKLDGKSGFTLKSGELDFRSTSYDDKSLTISEGKAIFKGTGTVNGKGKHKFHIVALDGALSKPGTKDGLRIRISGDGTNEALFDTHPSVAENSSQVLGIGGGSVVIHRPGGNSSKKDNKTKIGGKGDKKLGGVIGVSDRPSEKITEDGMASLLIYPNPLDANSKIQFNVTTRSAVTLAIFDFNGRELFRLFEGKVEENQVYEVDFDGSKLKPGVYICRLITNWGEGVYKQLMVN